MKGSGYTPGSCIQSRQRLNEREEHKRADPTLERQKQNVTDRSNNFDNWQVMQPYCEDQNGSKTMRICMGVWEIRHHGARHDHLKRSGAYNMSRRKRDGVCSPLHVFPWKKLEHADLRSVRCLFRLNWKALAANLEAARTWSMFSSWTTNYGSRSNWHRFFQKHVKRDSIPKSLFSRLNWLHHHPTFSNERKALAAKVEAARTDSMFPSQHLNPANVDSSKNGSAMAQIPGHYAPDWFGFTPFCQLRILSKSAFDASIRTLSSSQNKFRVGLTTYIQARVFRIWTSKRTNLISDVTYFWALTTNIVEESVTHIGQQWAILKRHNGAPYRARQNDKLRESAIWGLVEQSWTKRPIQQIVSISADAQVIQS